MRGDRPDIHDNQNRLLEFTPHARGSTFGLEQRIAVSLVYPACAGIDQVWGEHEPRITSLPRMRGDRPLLIFWLLLKLKFTPHARGSTWNQTNIGMIVSVYPACAGIDRLSTTIGTSGKSLPRMRGDRPDKLAALEQEKMFTPHARGSTVERLLKFNPHNVYPACAGIDR